MGACLAWVSTAEGLGVPRAVALELWRGHPYSRRLPAVEYARAAGWVRGVQLTSACWERVLVLERITTHDLLLRCRVSGLRRVQSLPIDVQAVGEAEGGRTDTPPGLGEPGKQPHTANGTAA